MALIDRGRGWIYSRGYEENMMQNENQNKDIDLDALFDQKTWSLPICKVIPLASAKEEKKSPTKIENGDDINEITRIFVRNLDDALYEKVKGWLTSNNLLKKEGSKSILVYRIEKRRSSKAETKHKKDDRIDQIVVIGSDLTDPYNERDINLIENALRLSFL